MRTAIIALFAAVVGVTLAGVSAGTASTGMATCVPDARSLNFLLASNEAAGDAVDLIEIEEYGLATRSINKAARVIRGKTPCDGHLRRAFSYQRTAITYEAKAISAYRAGNTSSGDRYIKLSIFYAGKISDALHDYRDNM